MDEKNKGGRPSDYDPKYCEEIVAYFNVEPNRETMRVITQKNGTTIKEPVEVPINLPTFAGFARKIGIHRETLLNWCKVHPEFFDAYMYAKECQDDILTTNALKSLYNPQYSQFFAKNALDDRYKDKTEQKLTMEKDGAAELADALLGKHTGSSDDPQSDKGPEEGDA